MGVRFVPQRAGDTLTVRAARGLAGALVLATEGQADVLIGEERHAADRATVVVVPRGAPATILARGPVTHVLVLEIGPALAAHVLELYRGEIDRVSLERALGTPGPLPRTQWLHEICHRYLFERSVCKKRHNDATRFLEAEIVKEVYFLARERAARRERRSLVETESAIVQRAIAIVEASLFDADVVARLPAAGGASASTLLRAFRREVGDSPLGYVRARRLDESLLLLKSRRFTVSEVATMIGYRNFAAFSHAFRARFERRPSAVRKGAAGAG